MMPNRDAQIAKNEARIAKEGIQKLEVGVSAPALSATATNGQFELSSALTGGGRVVLFFIPAVDTPNSTRELLQYSKDAASLAEKQITIYGIAKGSAAELADYKQRYGISIDMIADPGLAIAQTFGCALPGGDFAQRTVIGINPDGKIAFYRRHQLLKAEILKDFGVE
jgi:thioredoxin-dependent peroxiredoxin